METKFLFLANHSLISKSEPEFDKIWHTTLKRIVLVRTNNITCGFSRSVLVIDAIKSWMGNKMTLACSLLTETVSPFSPLSFCLSFQIFLVRSFLDLYSVNCDWEKHFFGLKQILLQSRYRKSRWSFFLFWFSWSSRVWFGLGSVWRLLTCLCFNLHLTYLTRLCSTTVLSFKKVKKHLYLQ